MSYLKKFDEWNNRYPEQSVTAAQYTYIKKLLEEVDINIESMINDNINLVNQQDSVTKGLIKNVDAFKGLITTIEKENEIWIKLLVVVGVGFTLSMILHYFVIFKFLLDKF